MRLVGILSFLLWSFISAMELNNEKEVAYINACKAKQNMANRIEVIESKLKALRELLSREQVTTVDSIQQEFNSTKSHLQELESSLAKLYVYIHQVPPNKSASDTDSSDSSY